MPMIKSETRILIVDDRERTVRTMRRLLMQEGYQVITALDGLAGLEKARQIRPDLVILDVMMPGLDGYEVCRRLHLDPETTHIPVILLTGVGRVDTPAVKGAALRTRVQQQEKGFDSGAVEFLTKPITKEKLLERVKSILWLGGSLG